MKILTRAILGWLIGAVAGGVAYAQAPPAAPDCTLAFNFTAAGSTGNFDNRVIACQSWVLQYEVTTFTGLTLTFQSATGATAAGTFGTYTGTTISGVNPNTNTTGRVATFSNGVVSVPWVRMNLSGLTGTGQIYGVLYGYKTGYTGGAGAAGCVGVVATPCIVAGPDAAGAVPTQSPVLSAGFDGTNVQRFRLDSGGRVDPSGAATTLADGSSNAPTVPRVNGVVETVPNYPFQFNGTTWDRQLRCNSTVVIDDSTSGNLQVIALSGSTKIYVCKMTLTSAAAVNIKLTQGTGANCVTGTADLTGLYQAVLTVAEDFVADNSPLASAAAQAVCLNLSATTRTTGLISYTQF